MYLIYSVTKQRTQQILTFQELEAVNVWHLWFINILKTYVFSFLYKSYTLLISSRYFLQSAICKSVSRLLKVLSVVKNVAIITS